MSKDLEKEYLEALGLVKRTCEIYIDTTRFLKGSDIIANQINEALNIIQNRLEAIENANPSEALERVIALVDGIDNYEKQTGRKNPPAYISRETLVELHHTLLKAYEDEEENKRLWNDITTVSKQYTDLMLEYQEQKRALDIIRGSNVDIIYLKESNNVEEYNSHFGAVVCKLTPEEYDAVRRYFK